MIDIGVSGLSRPGDYPAADLERVLREPTSDRIFLVAEAIRQGYSIDRLHDLTRIDPWFLNRIAAIVEVEAALHGAAPSLPPRDLLRTAKQLGFSDAQISELVDLPESAVRDARERHGLRPCVKQIDTLAAECPAKTNYLYLTYNGEDDDTSAVGEDTVLVLGSGAYRIGSSVEFDWCGVNTVQTLKELGYKTIMLNNNPETVSTDYNECDKLYFDELSLESVLAIWAKERPLGLIVSMGGQTPNNLVRRLDVAGVTILGTCPASIDAAEDRHKFSTLLDQLGIEQPAWKQLTTVHDAKLFAQEVGYPVLVRPSYVLSGAAMSVASNDTELERFLARATAVSPVHPVVLSKFVVNAKELEIDAVAREGEVVLSAISEHVENAGVHSGDATLVFPPQRTYLETLRRIRNVTGKIAAALQINGPFNLQLISKGNEVKVIECNLRASRSFPFVSKVLKLNFIAVATKVIMNRPVEKYNGTVFELEHVGVKAPQFSFTRLDGADPTLGVEMASTGEVACLGDDFEEAFLKALLSVGYRLPIRNILLSTGPVEAKAAFLECTRLLTQLGMNLYATKGTLEFMRADGIEATLLHWPLDARSPNALEYLSAGKIDLVINIPKSYQEEELTNDYLIRRRTVDFGIPLITNIQLAQRFVEALSRKQLTDLQIKSWREYEGSKPSAPPRSRNDGYDQSSRRSTRPEPAWR
jgi:carbamoyl-phosphate synthase large subunit